MIETKRLILRRYTEEDEGELYGILSDAVTMAYWPQPFSLLQVRDWIRRSIDSYAQEGYGGWAVVEKETMTLLGNCGLTKLELDGRMENDLGYIIFRDKWNLGYATEAANACMEYAFAAGITRVSANMPFDHVASQRIAEKIGMKRETEFINPRNRDILTYLSSAQSTGEGITHEQN